MVAAGEIRSSNNNNSTSSFAQTCNLLSQFLKAGKANLGDITLAAKLDHLRPGAGQPTTLNLLPSVGSDDEDCASLGRPAAGDLFSSPVESLPQLVPVGAPAGRNAAAAGGQMTIFYGGKVIVFDDFPAEKASEIMAMASGKGNNSSEERVTVTSPAVCGAASSSSSPEASNSGGGGQIERLPFRQPIPSDLPIARRASLHRFLEKRKDRVTSRGPYHMQSSNPGSPAAGKAPLQGNTSVVVNPWLDRQIAQSSKQLELSL